MTDEERINREKARVFGLTYEEYMRREEEGMCIACGSEHREGMK